MIGESYKEIRQIQRKIERLEIVRMTLSNGKRYLFGDEYEARVKNIADLDAQIAQLNRELDAADQAHDSAQQRMDENILRHGG